MKLLMLCSSSTIKTLSLIFIAVYLLLNFFIQRQLHGEPCAALRPVFASDAAAMEMCIRDRVGVSHRCSRRPFCRLGTPYAAPIRHLYDGDHFNRIQPMNFSAGRPNDLLNL